MEQSFYVFREVDSPQAVASVKKIFYDRTYEDGVLNKKYAQEFVNDLAAHIQNPSASSKSKFYSLMILKQIILKNDLKIIGILSNSNTLLEFLMNIILNTDPRKDIKQKGKNLFPQDQQGFGNKYITLIIEIILYLSKKFPKNSKNQPTRFRKVIMSLEQNGVNLPQQFTYLPNPHPKKQDSSRTDNKKQPQQKRSQQQDSNPTRQQIPLEQRQKKQQPLNVEALIRFVKFKIEQFLANLEDAEEVEEMQQIIMKTHEIFKGELIKFDELGDSIYQNSPTVVEEYLKVRGFLEEQSKVYDTEISKNEFQTYYDTIKIKYEEIFPQGGNGTPGNNRNSTKNQTKRSKQLKNTVNTNLNSNQPPAKVSTVNAQRQSDNRRAYDSNISGKQEIRRIERRQPARVSQDPISAISGIFERLQSREKSPYRGFKQLRDSLQKEKKNVHAMPSRLQISGKVGASTLSKSGLSTSNIFHNVPNPSPPYKNFEGELINSSKELQNILYDIKKQQSHRRFKVANFKNKSPLFENQTLQIGFKSQPIFQQYDGFSILLSMQLYFGNKSNRQIRDLQISFQGDENSLIYTNTRQIISYIDADSQIKHGLMIIPIKVPYSFTNMKLYYQCGDSMIRTTVALPNSILQLSTHIQTQKSEFRNYWGSSTKIFKTDQFKLTKHISPNSIRKYMPNLTQLTSYSEFSLAGSTTDYEVCCLVDINNDFEGALKINFRPDLTVVIQIAAISPSEDAVKYLKFYLQTLQMLLQETNG